VSCNGVLRFSVMASFALFARVLNIICASPDCLLFFVLIRRHKPPSFQTLRPAIGRRLLSSRFAVGHMVQTACGFRSIVPFCRDFPSCSCTFVVITLAFVCSPMIYALPAATFCRHCLGLYQAATVPPCCVTPALLGSHHVMLASHVNQYLFVVSFLRKMGDGTRFHFLPLWPFSPPPICHLILDDVGMMILVSSPLLTW